MSGGGGRGDREPSLRGGCGRHDGSVGGAYLSGARASRRVPAHQLSGAIPRDARVTPRIDRAVGRWALPFVCNS